MNLMDVANFMKPIDLIYNVIQKSYPVTFVVY